jgi:hypothetical protein
VSEIKYKHTVCMLCQDVGYLYISNVVLSISPHPLAFQSHNHCHFSVSSADSLAPEDIKSTPTNNRSRRRLGICIRNIDEMLNWDFFKRDYLCLLGEFISKIKDGEYRYIDIRRDESLVIPTIKSGKLM